MKFEEVLPLARDEGKKIRRTVWSPKHNIVINVGDQVRASAFDERSGCYNLSGDDLCADDWEVIEECPHKEGTGPWAAWMLERGKGVTCLRGDHVFRKGPSGLIVLHVDDGQWEAAYFYPEMLAATDWREVPNEHTDGR